MLEKQAVGFYFLGATIFVADPAPRREKHLLHFLHTCVIFVLLFHFVFLAGPAPRRTSSSDLALSVELFTSPPCHGAYANIPD